MRLLNDLTALGYSVPHLEHEQMNVVQRAQEYPGQPSQSLVVGIGTGFNVSPVLQLGQQVICPVAEAGHVGLPRAVSHALAENGVGDHSFQTVEELFSGRGFTAYCRQITGIGDLEGHQVTSNRSDKDAVFCVVSYSHLLGLLLRELYLMYMPASGFYFSGSVARAMISEAPDPCLEAFSKPCGIRGDDAVPFFLITDDSAALSGCARL